MKKIIVLNILAVSLLLTSCSIQQKTEKIPQVEPKAVQQTKEEKLKEINVSDTPTDISSFEIAGRYEMNLTNNENDDIISLYTSAQKDEEGNFMWEDNQTWVLQVETDNGVYELLQKNISGNIYFNVSEYYFEDGPKNVITVFELTNTTNKLTEFIYENEKFNQKEAYSTDEFAREGINPLYTSIPEYK